MANILICGNYGAGNIGDEAILRSLLLLVKRVDPKASITVMSARPEHTARLYQINAVAFIPAGIRSFLRFFSRGFIVKTLKSLKKADIFILGGGGLFQDEKKHAVFIWFLQGYFALLFKKPLYCCLQSIGPLNTFFAQRMVKWLFKRAVMITVRDSSSARLLKDLGIPSAVVLSDPVLSLPVQKFSYSSQERYIVLSIRFWNRGNNDFLHKNIAQFIDWIYEKYGLKTLFIPFEEYHDFDQKEMDKIFVHIENKSSFLSHEFTFDIDQILQVIASASMVVGMRLHSVIFSVLTSTPFIAISYSSKISNFLQDIESTDCVIDFKNFDFSLLRQKFEHVMKNRKHFTSLLQKKAFLFQQKTLDHERILKNLIQS